MRRGEVCLSTHQRERVIENVIAFKESTRKSVETNKRGWLFDVQRHRQSFYYWPIQDRIYNRASIELDRKIVIVI